MLTGIIESLITHINKSGGSRKFAPDTELEGGNKNTERWLHTSGETTA